MCLLCRNMRLRAFRRVEIVLSEAVFHFSSHRRTGTCDVSLETWSIVACVFEPCQNKRTGRCSLRGAVRAARYDSVSGADYWIFLFILPFGIESGTDYWKAYSSWSMAVWSFLRACVGWPRWFLERFSG